MSMLAMLIPGLIIKKPRATHVDTSSLSGGASELYGTCKAVVWQVVEDRSSFTVADVVKATGLNRVRVNRVLYRLSAEGKVCIKERSINRYTGPTVWSKVV